MKSNGDYCVQDFIIVICSAGSCIQLEGVPSFSLAVTIGWKEGLYVTTEGEDSQIFICADILNGTLETSIVAPFNVSQHTGMLMIYLDVIDTFVTLFNVNAHRDC